VSERRFAGFVMAGVLAVGVLSGCGATSARHGQRPPTVGPSVTAAASDLRTSFPEERLSFQVPELAGDQKPAVRAYIAFQWAFQHALRVGRMTAPLRESTLPALRLQLAPLIAGYRSAGKALPKTRVIIRDVTVAPSAASVEVCVVASDDRRPLSVVLASTRPSEDLRASAVVPDPDRRRC
jgi:hypothetical protein